ncbi:MAG: hypothetical protein ACI857_001878 [Arenicella sp.]|jgi:hypothetical protein
MAPFNIYIERALIETNSTLGIKDYDKMAHTQAFRMIGIDTINKIDEFGMLQGEWDRIYPDGSFPC